MFLNCFNPILHGGEGKFYPHSNFRASQLQHEGFFWSDIYMNLVTWVLMMTKTQNMFQNFNRAFDIQVVTKWSKKSLCNVGLIVIILPKEASDECLPACGGSWGSWWWWPRCWPPWTWCSWSRFLDRCLIIYWILWRGVKRKLLIPSEV